MSRLSTFNGDKATKEELLEYIYTIISKVAVKKMYSGEDVSHIKDAKELIDYAFNQLDIDYGLKLNKTQATNNSR